MKAKVWKMETTPMKTIAEANAYFRTLDRWQDEHGFVSDPGDLHDELYAFKATIDLSGAEAVFKETNVDEVMDAGSGEIPDWATWAVSFPGIGVAYLHLYDLTSADARSWAEFNLEEEPYWNGDDAYDCTWEQMAAVVAALPEEHRQRFIGLVSDGIKLAGILGEHRVIPSAPQP
jgi:hypothetical protein